MPRKNSTGPRQRAPTRPPREGRALWRTPTSGGAAAAALPLDALAADRREAIADEAAAAKATPAEATARPNRV
jgi:hypothetical protein